MSRVSTATASASNKASTSAAGPSSKPGDSSLSPSASPTVATKPPPIRLPASKAKLPGVSDPTQSADYQLVRKKLLEQTAVRNVEGERVQCNHCGKWLLIERWEGHLADRCRHKVR